MDFMIPSLKAKAKEVVKAVEKATTRRGVRVKMALRTALRGQVATRAVKVPKEIRVRARARMTDLF